MIFRTIETVMRPFDNEDRELILRLRLWKRNWFPYRTVELLGWNEDEDNPEAIWGDTMWHKPAKWKRR